MDTNKARRILETLAVLHIITGLLLPLLVELPIFNFYNRHLLAAFGADSAEALELAKFMIGILGPSIASWGVLFLLLVRYAYSTASRRAWKYMMVAVIGWSVYDSLLSIIAGVYLNVVIDLAVMSILLAPLILTREYFYRNS